MQLNKSREEIIDKVEELALTYEAAYRGCAESTFLAVVDGLRWGGTEIITPDVEDALFPGLQLLSGGVGLSGQGTCGAVAGGIMAIGQALAVLRGAAPRDMSTFLEGAGLAGAPCFMVTGDGSLMATAVARQRPVGTILSGPGSSVLGAARLAGVLAVGELAGRGDGVDLGEGVVDGPLVPPELQLAHPWRVDDQTSPGQAHQLAMRRRMPAAGVCCPDLARPLQFATRQAIDDRALPHTGRPEQCRRPAR